MEVEYPSQDISQPLDLCDSLCGSQKKCHVPAKFSNPDTITPPESLPELVDRLSEVFESDDISVEYVQKLMTSYTSKPKEWKAFAKWDPYRYTRNLVHEGNGKFNLMILCWNEAQGSSIHSHANSHCFLKVLDGCVKEEMFEWPPGCNPSESRDPAESRDQPTQMYEDHEEPAGMQKSGDEIFGKNSCAYINDSIGLHRVMNPSHSDKAVTLHLYSPPFDECHCFDERTGRATKSTVTFWSKFGKRTPFGRKPEDTSSFEAEND